MNWEVYVVAVIIAVVAVILFRSLARTLAGKDEGCNCSTSPGPGGHTGCHGCGCEGKFKGLDQLKDLPVDNPPE